MTQSQLEHAYNYLMEGNDESERLLLKDDGAATLGQLLETGFGKLPTSPRVVDAGAGVGVVANQMASLLRARYHEPEMILLDGSRERLEAASRNLSSYVDIKTRFLACNLENIPLPDETVDYVFCRFVFEYLSDPSSVFSELSRIVKPGGKLVIGDLDHNCLNHYPMPGDIDRKLQLLVNAVDDTGLFDFYAGRKLYSFFYNNKFQNISVHMHSHHLFYGDLKSSDAINWEIKLNRLIKLQQDNVIQLDLDLLQFKNEFLDFLRRPDRFSYTPLIIVEGIKPR